jgi:hypothetical protein
MPLRTDLVSIPAPKLEPSPLHVLSSVDSATAVVHAHATADNGIVDIRINGVSTGITKKIGTVADDFTASVLDIPAKFWLSGVNQIEVVVRNDDWAPGTQTNMGLQLKWSASGCARGPLELSLPRAPLLPEDMPVPSRCRA